MHPNPLVPRLVVITLTCGHAVPIAIPPEVDPDPGDALHCYTCDADVQVVSVVTHAEAAAEAAATPILSLSKSITHPPEGDL